MERADNVLGVFRGNAAPDIRKVALLTEEASDDDCFREAASDLVTAQANVTKRLGRNADDTDGVRAKAGERLQDVGCGGISGDDADG